MSPVATPTSGNALLDVADVSRARPHSARGVARVGRPGRGGPAGAATTRTCVGRRLSAVRTPGSATGGGR